MNVIGIDCATEPKKVGLAHAQFMDSRVVLRELRDCKTDKTAIEDTVLRWVHAAQGPTLIGLDAPLGWPATLGDGLRGHKAGALLPGTGDKLFNRETDRFIRKHVGKPPLAVGADRIARTALWALNLLNELRAQLKQPIRLAWDPRELGAACPVAAIEVYPAATLKVRRLPFEKYKDPEDPEQHEVRRAIVQGLCREIELGAHRRLAEEVADALDAVVCVVACADFISNMCVQPADSALAEREGWIWVRHHSNP